MVDPMEQVESGERQAVQMPLAVGRRWRVLIGCERSGVVRDAFTAAGHDAVSCDLEPSETPGQHHQGSVLEILSDGWDLMIAHPPCRFLALSGARWAHDHVVKSKRRGDWKYDGSEYRANRAQALKFFRQLWNAPIPRICLENPSSLAATMFRRPDQVIQPYWFGHGQKKRTCLWLKNLPPLQTTNHVDGRDEFVLKVGPENPDRAAIRSKTFRGIAQAMAEQWAGIL